MNSLFDRRTNKAMALVITLSAVVLLTVLVMTFFGRALLNRQISYSSTSLTKADFLAHSALDIIVGEVRNEITNASHSVLYTGRPFYIPKTATDALPQTSGLVSSTGSLIKVSGSNVLFAPGSSLAGSSFSTGTPSRNGRFLAAASWFTSADSPQLGSSKVVPTWLFMTRENGVKTPAIADARTSASADCVIGRFAYCIYDIGGLLDANVSGYPAAAATNAAFKPSPAYADLAALGVSSTADFIAWRNATTGADSATFQEWATGIVRTSGTANQAALATQRTGYRSAVLGDNAVFSRRDLLNNPQLAGYEALLTHFSRSVNAPISSTSSQVFSNGGSVTHYLDDATTETYSVSSGDLLLQRRFSLAKLSWLTWRGPKSGISAEAIQSCFGLRWNDSDTTNKYWEYVGPTGTAVQSQIKTLAAVAAETSVREPNFFELLKAGIASDSLGRAADRTTLALTEQQTREGVADLQILRIGANFIDCVGADNFPTTVVLNFGGINVPVHGVKNLPYLYGMVYGRIGLNTLVSSTSQSMEHCSLLMAPILFNPHASSTGTGQSPAAIRVRIASGSFSSVYWQPLGNSAGTALTRSVTGTEGDLTSRPTINIPASAFETFRSSMSVIRGNHATSSTRLDSFDSSISAQDGDVHGFRYYTYTDLPETFPSYDGSGKAYAGNILSTSGNLLVVLEYQDPEDSTVWHVYDTLAGNEAFSVTGIAEGGTRLSFGPGINPITTGASKATTTLGWVAMKFDPRTTRFGLGRGETFFTTGTCPISSSAYKGIDTFLPFGTGTTTSSSTPSGIYVGQWAEGGTNSWTGTDGALINNIADNSTAGVAITRPADGWLGSGAANLFRNYGDANRRPVIPARPFKTVGEMGYVFRDSPWKTLSFFDGTSGDAALLELFAVSDQPAITAGRVHLNSRRPLTQQSLLAGAGQSFDGSSPLENPADIATAYQSYAFNAGSPTANQPMTLGALTGFISSSNLNSVYPTVSNPMKNRRESIIRAVAGSSQARTWNLLIDVVAQTGKYASSATSLDQFIVEGQQRYWLSLAIDRYTGKIIDQQLEADQ